MNLESGINLLETRLVQAKDDFDGDLFIRASDPKPLEEMVREVMRLFRDSKGYNQAKELRHAAEILAAFHLRIAIAQYTEK
ncbi:hypothetical protein R1flu_009072 [Riccia fluitans]|uniref:Uncharacterized protein n=1 Tax=Riccia fluitans TaxID=41844 RepID=A0ABD1Z193_9MARC